MDNVISSSSLQDEKFTDENIRAEEAITSGNFPEAAKILVGIIDKDPDNFRAYNNMGVLSWSRESWNDAYVMFKKAVSLKNDYNDALVNLFDASLKLKKALEILPILERALQTNPDLSEIRAIRDAIAEQGEDIYSSRRAYSVGIYSPIIEAAKKELEAGNLNKAMEKFLEANDTEGPSAEAFCGLGIISFYQERYSDAFSLFVESIKLNPSDTDTYLNLLDAAKECNRLKYAKEVFDAYRKNFSELESIAAEFDAIQAETAEEKV